MGQRQNIGQRRVDDKHVREEIQSRYGQDEARYRVLETLVSQKLKIEISSFSGMANPSSCGLSRSALSGM